MYLKVSNGSPIKPALEACFVKNIEAAEKVIEVIRTSAPWADDSASYLGREVYKAVVTRNYRWWIIECYEEYAVQNALGLANIDIPKLVSNSHFESGTRYLSYEKAQAAATRAIDRFKANRLSAKLVSVEQV